MDPEVKELAAIAASIAGRCQPCLRHHLEKAKQLGIAKQQVEEAIEVGRKVNSVGGDKMWEFSLDLIKDW
ncbi:MAG: carboxymuconolactone decarboxylase family protein [Methanomassiliicoccales archaeon]|nr:carboxymuconolactone decarboxylase family protein [Methanomassiliicoccales archaeon]NYT15321.1 carboxymuconolactone decarboxylase family protein [Methanomassiliicoccales archaeon]